MTDYFDNRGAKIPSGVAEAYSSLVKNCRGWQLWDFAVSLEPPFTPMRLATRPVTPVPDDTRLPGRFRRIFVSGDSAIEYQTPRASPITATDEKDVVPPAFYRTEDLSELQILPSKDLEVSSTLSEQLLLSLTASRSPVSFEIMADAQKITVQFACDRSLALHLKSQLNTFATGNFISEHYGQLTDYLDAQNTIIADFGLARNFVLPLHVPRAVGPDTLTALISSLGDLRGPDRALFQVLFQKAYSPWGDQLRTLFGHPGFREILGNNSQTLISALKEKLSAPFFAVVVRLAVSSSNEQRRWELLKRLGAGLAVFASPGGNEFIALSNDGYSQSNHFLSLSSRTSYRSGMILNAFELAALAHLPSGAIHAANLERYDASTKPIPAFATGYTLDLGENLHHGARSRVTLSDDQRTKHVHLIGATGSGKSHLMLQMARQDAELGNGFAIIEPHGDLIDNIVERIPEARQKDVILFDPADEDFPIGFNILSAHSELEKTLLSSDLVSIFRRFSTSWGDVMNSILANAVLAFLESDQGGSLVDLKRFLIEPDFRQDFVETVPDEEIRYYWQNEFPQIKGKPYAPLLTRLDTFLRSRLIRRIISQKENRLDFRRIMDERKILLVRLSLGAIGDENAYLLGSLFVAKFHQAALSRQNVSEEQRPPFFLYLDEAHHFLTPGINQILSGLRKYRFGLVTAHQQLNQFQTGDADILSSVLSNSYTRVCFRLDDADAERMAKGFSFFTAEHLKNLGVGEAIGRFEQSRYDFNLKTFPLEHVDPEKARLRRSAVTDLTRKAYARHKSEVDAELQNRPSNISMQEPTQSAIQPTGSQLSDETEIQMRDPDNTPRFVYPGNAGEFHGRGGQHHREFQAVIKRVAESYGFQVEIEKAVLNGTGSVDVSLEKDDLKIACEVSVTSTTDYELQNIRKCLAAGYDYAIVVASNQKKIPQLRSKFQISVPLEQQNQIKAFSITGLLEFLRELTPKQIIREKAEKLPGQRLNFAEACEFFDINPSTLYRWVRQGKIPFYRPGREYQFDRNELALLGREDLSGKRKTTVEVEQLRIEKTAPKAKKKQDARYRKLLKLE
jgi:excisionase family DNA binding protein